MIVLVHLHIQFVQREKSGWLMAQLQIVDEVSCNFATTMSGGLSAMMALETMQMLPQWSVTNWDSIVSVRNQLSQSVLYQKVLQLHAIEIFIIDKLL